MRRAGAAFAIFALLATTAVAVADVVPRAAPAAGSVIARKSGEEVQFIDISGWRGVDIAQNLLPGDLLRTNAFGQLAVLFSDRTQVRLGRNTTLRVKKIGAASDTELGLESGTIWARAERGGVGLTVETPAAAAAIRGTDWTLTVGADGRTSLVVLEGRVELSNALGSVSVAGGEAAAAAIGQAPAKIVIVDPKDREQMLFYLSLRGSFGFLPATTLSSPAMRREQARIDAVPEAARSGEDWLTLAEVSLSYRGRKAAVAALARAREFRLTRAQQARADLVAAMIAGAEQRYGEAASLFERARRDLDPRRGALATYGGYFARSIADPDRIEQPPAIRDGGPYAAIAAALTAGFLTDIKAAIAVVAKAERDYPGDPTLPAVRAQLALLLDDRPQVEEATNRALALDPDDPTALEARANYRASIKGDITGARADLLRAVSIAPGSTTIWNALGLVEDTRGARRESEAAFRRAIELDPQDPVSRANLAILYLEQDRLEEAKREIDAALALDPSFDIGLIARGRYHLQTGEMDKAMQDLLAGTTANPSYAQGLLMLSAGYYESGQREPAAQALDNADRMDPNDPAAASFRTALAIDEYRADEAIEAARETVTRIRARGGDFSTLSATKDAGSTLNDAYRLQGLDAWGRYYGQAVFDPFSATAYVDQALAGSPDPFVFDFLPGTPVVDPVLNDTAFSSFFQGLMLDPAMLSGRSRSANLFRRPFLEGSLGGGVTISGGDVGWTTEAELQGYAAGPFPWSFYGKLDIRRPEASRSDIAPDYVEYNLEDMLGTGTAYLTASPTPNDRVVIYADGRSHKKDFHDNVIAFAEAIPIIPGAADLIGLSYDEAVRDRTATGGVAWSHTFSYRNVANAAFFASGFKRESAQQALMVLDVPGPQPAVGLRELEASDRLTSYLAALNHTVGTGDLTLRYGIEAGSISQKTTASDLTYIPPIQIPPFTLPETIDFTSSTSEASVFVGRAYLSGLYDISPALRLEAGVFGTRMSGDRDLTRFDPRLGVAWAPGEGHWLRAGFLRETEAANATTLAPIGLLGLQSNQIPLALGGYSDTFAARWDAEWNERLFTSLDYQHQTARDISIPDPVTIAATSIEGGRLDRIAATANLHLGGGFGLFATAAWSDSEITRGQGIGNRLPFVPDLSARMGLTYVSDRNVKVTIAGTYVGERTGDVLGTPLAAYWTADAFLTWEPLDKRFAVELAAYNLLDRKFSVDYDVPGWGRTFTGSLKVRF